MNDRGRVTIEFLSLMQILTGVELLDLEIEQEVTVEHLLRTIGGRYEAFGSYLGDDFGPNVFNDKILVLANGRRLGRLDAMVKAGDNLILLVPVCGG